MVISFLVLIYQLWGAPKVRKAHSLDFPLYFQLPQLLEETCFPQRGSSALEGTNQAILGSSDQPKLPASLSLFLKSGKIPALLYVGKGREYKPFCDFRPVLSAYSGPSLRQILFLVMGSPSKSNVIKLRTMIKQQFCETSHLRYKSRAFGQRICMHSLLLFFFFSSLCFLQLTVPINLLLLSQKKFFTLLLRIGLFCTWSHFA